MVMQLYAYVLWIKGNQVDLILIVILHVCIQVKWENKLFKCSENILMVFQILNQVESRWIDIYIRRQTPSKGTHFVCTSVKRYDIVDFFVNWVLTNHNTPQGAKYFNSVVMFLVKKNKGRTKTLACVQVFDHVMLQKKKY